MKRKLVCLLLAFATVFSCFAFAGCSDQSGDKTVESTETDGSSLSTVTLTLWVPTDEDTTEEAILAVEEAINKITKAKFETAIELHAIPSDKYDAAIEARITEIEEHIAFEEEEAARKRKEAASLAAQGITTVPETTAPETTAPEGEDTYVNDIGMQLLKYPKVGEYQMDIFLVRGYENYVSYIDREALSELDSDLTGNSKVLNQYIYPTFLSSAKFEGTTYAIPNNHVVGEYQYLLVNKRLVDELYWDPDDLNTLLKCKDFILDVKARTDVVPMLAPVEASGMKYWSLEQDNAFSLISSQIPTSSTLLTFCMPRSTLAIKGYSDTVHMMKALEEADCFAADPTKVEEFGVGVISGDASVLADYEEDYYVKIYQAPLFTVEEVYNSMFAVSTYTKDVSRSMEIITALNTDPELRTILQYGVEDIHWRVNPENTEVIDVISDDYKMNLVETGNVYMTYPAPGVSREYWEYGKVQNLAAQVDPFLGFDASTFLTEANKADYEELARLSKDVYDRIEAMTADEFAAALTDLRKEIATNETVAKLINKDEPESLSSYYREFYLGNGGQIDE